MRYTYAVQPYGCKLVFTDTLKEFHALAPYDGRGADGAVAPGKRADFVLGVFDRHWLTLVHECVHAASMILTHCGIDPQSNHAEPLAYLVDHLVAVGAKRLKLR